MKREENEIIRSCLYCEHAAKISITDNMLCEKKGIVANDYHCSSFSYDPLKRVPTVLPKAPELEFIPLEEVSEEASVGAEEEKTDKL